MLQNTKIQQLKFKKALREEILLKRYTGIKNRHKYY